MINGMKVFIKNWFQKNNISALFVCILLVAGVFFVGFRVGKAHGNVIAVAGVDNETSGEPSGVDFSTFWKAWNLINEKYVPTHSSTTPSAQDRVYGAIEGMTSSLGDPYTVFFPPVQNEIFTSDVRGNFEGVGMEVDVENNVLTVIAPLKGTPADRAGVKPGDKILKINGTSTVGFTSDQAITLIRGKSGTNVTITVSRAGVKDPFDIVMTRGVIDIPTISSKLLPSGVFEIDLYSFSATSPDLFRTALRQFIQSGSDKLIIDLRGNPGGYLDAALDIASWFLPAGKTVVTEDFAGKADPVVYKSRGYNVFNSNLKLAILVDGGSASASEILAGALSQNGVAKLVGEKTFGKGSVQELVDITPDTSLKVTVARWLTPNGSSIAAQGLTPDYIVDLTKDDVTAGRDPQKDKAVQILTSQ